MGAHVPGRAVKLFRSKRGWAVIVAVVVALFLFRPGVTRLRNRIARSIGSALGRQVTLQGVRIHALPRPGFDLEGLVIFDDPAFSAEPMVRAQDVGAHIRISSLFRGRLEIATLSASEPSINLVRNSDGHWNLESLLERSAHIPIAPTSKAVSEHRPAFPYMEATHARINLKLGQEKKSYALNDADLALWQDSEDSWATRVTAQPVRTDFNLTDTGRIRVNATWRRAARLGETPLQAAFRWENGQLGQITKLFSGRDRGWRGGVNLAADVSGTPEALLVHTQLSIDDIHRYDISGGDNVRLLTACTGRYSTADRTLRELACNSPVGIGMVRVEGSIGPITAQPAYDVKLTLDQIPVPSVLRLVRQAKRDLPRDLVATGQMDAKFAAQSNGTVAQAVSGTGSIADLRFTLNNGKTEIGFGDIPLALIGAVVPPLKRQVEAGPVEAHLQFGPFPLGMGSPGPATAQGWLSLSGYRFSLHGDAQIANLFRLANALALPGMRPAVEGSARVDVAVAGAWQGFAPPVAIGLAQLHNVHAEMREFDVPVEISSAFVNLDSDSVTVRKLAAATHTTHWSGSVRVPRPCPPTDCVIQFDLNADQLAVADLQNWFMPRPVNRPWYRILSSSATNEKSPWLVMRANGTVHVGRLGWKKIVATDVRSRVEMNRGVITLSDMQGQTLAGSHQGGWVIDASVQPPHWRASGSLSGITLAQATGLVDDGWITGTSDAKYQFSGSGNTLSEFFAHADGEMQFSLQNGMLKNLDLAGALRPFPINRFSGELTLKKGMWELQRGKLQSHDGIYQVSGTASPAGGLDFVFLRGDDQKWNVTGTLAKPRVVPASRTEARSTTLKP